MKDRVPENPGRVLITPEDGSSPFYATMTRADNPTQNGDPLNKATLLKDETAALYGMGSTAVPDDVLQMLTNLVGRYRIELNLTFEGRAMSGVEISGLAGLNGETVYTDASGTAVGYTYERTGNIGIPQVFVDIQPVEISYDTGGKLLTIITYDAKTDGAETYEITTSGEIMFSNTIPALDFFLVGGGASGAVGASVLGLFTGGGGGYTKTVLNVENTTDAFTVVIGAGGITTISSGRKAGVDGGSTSLSRNGMQIEIADGGKGGKCSVTGGSSSTYDTADGADGGSGSGSGYVGRYGGSVKSPGTDGSDGGSNTAYITGNGGKGQGTTTKAFGEDSGIAYSAGGGTVAKFDDGDSTRTGTSGNGIASLTSGNITSKGTNYGDGGGGANSYSGYSATSEGKQGVIIARRRAA